MAAAASSISSSSSDSEKLRRRGNLLYSQIKASLSEDSSSRLSPVLLTDKLENCSSLYNRSLAASKTCQERSSSCKNIAMVHFLHLKVLLAQCAPPTLPDKMMPTWKYHISTSVHHFLEAFRYGIVDGCKPSTWCEDLVLSFDSMVVWISQTSTSLGLSHSPLLQVLCNAIDDHCSGQGRSRLDLTRHPSLSASFCGAYKEYSDALFKETLTLQTPDDDEFFMDFRKCSSLLHDSSLYLRKARGFLPPNLEAGGQGSSSSLTEEIKELEKSVQVHLCICEALQHIGLGDMAMERALRGDEALEMDYVKDALDCYRVAASATKEKDTETEGLAMSRIGDVYGGTLKMEKGAHKFYFQAMRLALTVMSPRIARSQWYNRAIEKVRAHQAKVAEEEKAEQEKKREPAMERLKTKLKKLAMESEKGAASFLMFVYKEHVHPDMKRNVVPLMDSPEAVKKSLKMAIQHYHPDTNASHGGDDWKVLCEEIWSFCLFVSFQLQMK